MNLYHVTFARVTRVDDTQLGMPRSASNTQKALAIVALLHARFIVGGAGSTGD